MNFCFKDVMTEELPEIGHKQLKPFPKKDSKSDTEVGGKWLVASFKLIPPPSQVHNFEAYLAEGITVKRQFAYGYRRTVGSWRIRERKI